MTEVRLIVSGFSGTMGEKVRKQAKEANGVIIVGGIEKDKEGRTVCTVLNETPGRYVIIDFSLPDATSELMKYAVERSYPLAIGTTGHTEEQKEQIRLAAQKIPIIMASNFSIGAKFFTEAIAQIVKAYKKLGIGVEIKITEWHHIRKKDAPSGTAKVLKDRILSELDSQKPIPIESIREGDIIGIHKIEITAGNEVIELLHKVQDRAVFADGAIEAAKFIAGMPPGLYNMDDLIKN